MTMATALFDVAPVTPAPKRKPGRPVRIPSDRTRPTEFGAAHPGPANPLMKLVFTEGTPETGFGLDLVPVVIPAEPCPEEITDVVISHSSEAGTLLTGANKGDGVYDALHAAGIRWRSFRNATGAGYPSGTLYVPQSRDKAPKMGTIRGSERVLREAGFTVLVEIDAAPREYDAVKAARIERGYERAAALDDKADRRASAANAHHATADQIAERFAFGQPILIGHHSERRARRDQGRIHSNMRKAIDLGNEAKLTASRAKVAEANAASLEHGEHPHRIVRRIEKLEADERRIQRLLDGYVRNFRDGHGELYHVETHGPATDGYREQLLVELEHLRVQLDGNRADLQAAKDAGRYNPIDPKAIKKGDYVKYRGEWRRVVKVNRTTVSVETGYSWADKAPLAELQAHKPAESVPAPVATEDEQGDVPAPKAKPGPRHSWVPTGDGQKTCERCGTGITRVGRGWTWKTREGKAATVNGEQLSEGQAAKLADLPSCGSVDLRKA